MRPFTVAPKIMSSPLQPLRRRLGWPTRARPPDVQKRAT
jgi:hypothetical protein